MNHEDRHPDGDPPGALVWTCAADGLAPVLVQDLAEVAHEYHAQSGLPLRVVSGRRTLRHQAELMAGMSRAQLEGMYCTKGYPDYVRRLVALREETGTATPEQAYAILSRRAEGYVSAHLSGAAVDLAATGAEVELLKRLLVAHGFKVLDERALGLPCIHATHAATPLAIVRE